MNTSRKGNAAENFVARELEGADWLVGSRRHIGGAGDLLALHPDHRGRLVEVKATKTPFSGFPPDDRAALRQTAAQYGVDAYLAWRKGGETRWLAESDWP